jgi:hypothetical protein
VQYVPTPLSLPFPPALTHEAEGGPPPVPPEEAVLVLVEPPAPVVVVPVPVPELQAMAESVSASATTMAVGWNLMIFFGSLGGAQDVIVTLWFAARLSASRASA